MKEGSKGKRGPQRDSEVRLALLIALRRTGSTRQTLVLSESSSSDLITATGPRLLKDVRFSILSH